MARVLLVDGLTITDSRARWRVCWRVHVGVHVARGMLDYSAQLSTALNYSSSHHSSCVRGSSGPSMRASVLCQYSTASRFKLEHAVSVLLSPLKNVCCATHFHMHRVHHGGCGAPWLCFCFMRHSWQQVYHKVAANDDANETEATYSE